MKKNKSQRWRRQRRLSCADFSWQDKPRPVYSAVPGRTKMLVKPFSGGLSHEQYEHLQNHISPCTGVRFGLKKTRILHRKLKEINLILNKSKSKMKRNQKKIEERKRKILTKIYQTYRYSPNIEINESVFKLIDIFFSFLIQNVAMNSFLLLSFS